MSAQEISRRERKKDETRERITQAALQLFSERGYEATTVDDIALKADVAKGTFFNYFARKEAIFDALAEQKVAAIGDRTRELLELPISTREKLSLFCGGIGEEHIAHRELSRYMVTRMLTQFHDPIHNVPATMRAHMRSLIEQGQDKGEFRREVDAGRAASVIQGAAIGTLFAWYCAPEGSFALESELQERLKLILDGLAVQKGAAR